MTRDVAAPTRLFVYGTLLFSDVLARVAGRRLEGREAVLPGYARHAVRGVVYPGVVRTPGAATEGRLVEGVDALALARIDRFEGRIYERRRLPVRVAGRAGFVHAGVYVVPPARRHLLDHAPWDPEAFAARHLADYLEGCAAFDAAERRRPAG